MKILLKVFNPFIWIVNTINYQSHVDSQQFSKNYIKYDFDKDFKYF